MKLWLCKCREICYFSVKMWCSSKFQNEQSSLTSTVGFSYNFGKLKTLSSLFRTQDVLNVLMTNFAYIIFDYILGLTLNFKFSSMLISLILFILFVNTLINTQRVDRSMDSICWRTKRFTSIQTERRD